MRVIDGIGAGSAHVSDIGRWIHVLHGISFRARVQYLRTMRQYGICPHVSGTSFSCEMCSLRPSLVLEGVWAGYGKSMSRKCIEPNSVGLAEGDTNGYGCAAANPVRR